MSNISDYTSVSTIASGDLLVVYDVSESDNRKLSISSLQSYLQSNLSFTTGASVGAYTTQYAAPSATGFSVTITDEDDDDANVHLILTPVAGYAAGTIVLPAVASLIDKQEVLVNCTQAVTTLTIDKNGATALTGAPTTLAANNFFRLKYDLATSTWYRVG